MEQQKVNPGRVVIIDSNIKIQQVLKNFLEEEGYEVQIAFNGQAGIDLVKSNAPDLVILDLVLPIKDGIEVLRELRQDRETVKAAKVVLTNIDEKSKMEEAMNEGASLYLIKSRHKLKEILSSVKEVIAAREVSQKNAPIMDDLVVMFNDDEFLLGIFEGLFRKKGYRFSGFNSVPLSGVSRILQDTVPSIILVDLVMCFDGIKVIESFRSDGRFAAVPIIILDNVTSEAEVERAKGMGANEYISLKDSSPSAVADQVEVIIKKKKTNPVI